ncbi:MAG: hypothetical protein AAGI10_00340 [Pseudomonadota bacterium]
MTKQIFQRHFPNFDLIDNTQPYEMTDGFDAAIGAALSELRAIEDTEEMSSALEEILEAIEGAVGYLVSEMIPDSGETAQVHYAVQDKTLLKVSSAKQLERLRSDNKESDTQFRVTNDTMERDMQAVLDCLTADRVTEELDAPTFVERLRGAFHRLRGSAASMEPPFGELQNRSNKIVSRLLIAEKIVGALQSEVSPQFTNQSPEMGQAFSDLSLLTENARGFAEEFEKFATISVEGISRIKEDICSDANIAGAEGESVLVSREAERHALFRPAPILWAVCITFLAKIVLAHNSSETVHGLAIPILIGTALLTWISSVSFGIWNRKRRMRDLQRHIRQQFRQVLQDPKNTDELIEFPPICSDHAAPKADQIQAYPYRGKIKFHRMRVAALNLWALAIPIVLLVIVLITRAPDEQRFIARFEGSAPCTLAQGRLVFASQTSFFVLPEDRNDTVWKKALGHAFPEVLADVVPREHVLSVKDATIETQILDCVVADPNQNAFTVTHAGNALGIWGEQENFASVTLALENLATAVSTGAPVQIDLEHHLPDDGLTLDLGDQNLNVLANAIAQGGFGPPITLNPTILQARNVIAVELSKTEIEDIDLRLVLDAVKTIGEAAGRDITIEQALSLAFSSHEAFSNELVLPSSLIAHFEGDETLLSELRALRLSSEASNELTQTFLSAFEANALIDNDIISNQLAVVIEGQQQVLTSIAASRGETILVSPVVQTALVPNTNSANRTNIFQTLIQIDGETTEVENLGNTLVLPVFTEPVTNGTGDLNTAEGAFKWGQDVTKLRDIEVRDDGTTYFDRIAQTLGACLVGDAIIEIDVLGLASRSWDGIDDPTLTSALNYHLAEGRRIGALLKIIEGISDTQLLSRILVRKSEGSLPLSSMLAFLDTDPTVEETLSYLGRFEDGPSFERRRNTLLDVSGLSGSKESPLGELFARSVLLRVISTDSGPCAF